MPKYFNWKVKKIKEIIRDTIENKSFNKNSLEMIKFNIFDEMNEYFQKIREFEDIYKLNINLTLIDGEDSWNTLL